MNECGGFGIGARSGHEFLAFEMGEPTDGPPQRIWFNERQRRVSLFASFGRRTMGPGARYHLVGKRNGEIVATAVVRAPTRAYTEVGVKAKRGFDRVVFTARVPDNGLVVDDLEFVPVN